MKATVQHKAPRRRVDRLPGKATGEPSRPSTSRVITIERDDPRELVPIAEMTYRVRLERVVEPKGYLGGAAAATTTTTYLDGLCVTRTAAGEFFQEETMTNAAIPVRSKDVADFGRLSQAAAALAKVLGRYSADNPPSAEQMESILRSYRNILEWRRKARESLTRAEGEIDVLEQMLRQLL